VKALVVAGTPSQHHEGCPAFEPVLLEVRPDWLVIGGDRLAYDGYAYAGAFESGRSLRMRKSCG
jgi:hypothetical protein